MGFGLRVLGKRRGCYPHVYNQLQLYNTFIEPLLCKCYEHSIILWVSGKPNPHSDADLKYIAAQKEFHTSTQTVPPVPLGTSEKVSGHPERTLSAFATGWNVLSVLGGNGKNIAFYPLFL